MRVPRNQNGATLLGVLMVSTMLGVVALEVVSFFEKLQRETANIRFHGETAALSRSIQNVLAQTNLCSQAIRNDNPDVNAVPPNLFVVWDPGTAAINFPGAADAKSATVYRVYGGTNTLVARIGEVFSPAWTPTVDGSTPKNSSTLNKITGMFQITDMYVRRSYQDLDGVAQADGQATLKNAAGVPTTYTTVTAKLVIQSQYCGYDGSLCKDVDQAVRDRTLVAANRKFNVNSTTNTVDVTVAINPATKTIEACYQPSQKKFLGVTCGPGNVYLGAPNDCPNPTPKGCQNIYFVEGLDGQGTPICACHRVCQAFFKGPQGTASFHAGTTANMLLLTQVTNKQANQSPNTWDIGGGGGYIGFSYAAYGSSSALLSPISQPSAGTTK